MSSVFVSEEDCSQGQRKINIVDSFYEIQEAFDCVLLINCMTLARSAYSFGPWFLNLKLSNFVN